MSFQSRSFKSRQLADDGSLKMAVETSAVAEVRKQSHKQKDKTKRVRLPTEGKKLAVEELFSKLLRLTRAKKEKPDVERTFREERVKEWTLIQSMSTQEFAKCDAEAKTALMHIIPSTLRGQRFQGLIVPKENAPQSLRSTFQHLALLVKRDLISESRPVDGGEDRAVFFQPNCRPLASVPSTAVALNDWCAANMMIFHNLAGLMYGISLSFCNPLHCPIMTVGDHYEYMWCDGDRVVDPISIPARVYIKFCLMWIREQLKNPQVIPSTPQANYTVNAMSIWKMMYRRLLRVFAHLHTDHAEDFAALGLDRLLFAMLRRCILFGLETGLTSKKELEPIRDSLKRVQREFRLNQSCE